MPRSSTGKLCTCRWPGGRRSVERTTGLAWPAIFRAQRSLAAIYWSFIGRTYRASLRASGPFEARRANRLEGFLYVHSASRLDREVLTMLPPKVVFRGRRVVRLIV